MFIILSTSIFIQERSMLFIHRKKSCILNHPKAGVTALATDAKDIVPLGY